MKKRLVVMLLMVIFLLGNIQVAYGGEVISYIIGTWQGTKNTLDFSYPYKGDIYFGGNTGGIYGYFTHVALARDTTYIRSYTYTYEGTGETVSGTGWSGMTVESTTTGTNNSVISRDVHRFWFYDWAAEGYVNSATTTQKQNAVDYAYNYFYGPWDVYSDFWSNSSWQCSKLVERAYYDMANHLQLGHWGFTAPSLPIPDDIYYDPDVTIYTLSSAVSKNTLPKHALDRLDEWKKKGVDTSNIKFQMGIQKDGFANYLVNLEKRGINKEEVKKKYNIDDNQYNQIISDSTNNKL